MRKPYLSSVIFLFAVFTVPLFLMDSQAGGQQSTSPWNLDFERARTRSMEIVPLAEKVLEETPVERRQRLGENVPTLKDIGFNYFLMDSPIIKRETDLYGPVRFMHKKHAGLIQDCLTCHHQRSADPKDPEVNRCLSCHQETFNPKAPDRPSLKNVLHRQCIDCHREWKQGPVGCNDCHLKKTPDHNELVYLPANPKPTDVTRECLRCHDSQANEMLTSTHWLWKGPSPFTEGHERQINLGKATKTVNNFLINIAGNWPLCTSCHAGYGFKDSSFDFTDKTKIDCLVCHDTTGTYKKEPYGAGMPSPEVDLVKVAKNVGTTSRNSCGNCHFSGGAEDPIKHGKLNPVQAFHGNNYDVHMGGLGFECYECHKTVNHKIAGRSLALPVAEGSRSCADCHTLKPHQGDGLLNVHLNRHTQHMACMTCHNPIYAARAPVKTFWDWSRAGDKKKTVTMDKNGAPDYDWKFGSFVWQSNIKPTYAWYNGKVRRHLLGDKINGQGPTLITSPVGNIKDPKSTIYPFKVMRGKQAADKEHNYLLVPKLGGPDGYWESLDWNKAFTEGMKEAGLPYSGEYKWVDTTMYLGLTHEVMARNLALSCVQCHVSLRAEKTCDRCHQNKEGIDFQKLANKNLDFKFLHGKGFMAGSVRENSGYIDFKKLGYKGDPIIYGGRFKQLPLGWADDVTKKR